MSQVRMDAHQHYWKVNRGDYGWLTPDSGSIYRDFLPEDLHPHLNRCGISQTIVVQAAPTVAETEFLLELANEEPTVAGVVGWLDLSADDFPAQFERLQLQPKFVGIRPMLQDLPEDDWILQEPVINNVALLDEQNFPIDILVFPRHLPYIVQLLERFPTLRATIDHLAKPYIKDRVVEPWSALMTQIAAFPSVMCKLSGMVTEADHQHWKPSDLRPYVEHVLNVFGPNRVMFGSDYPVCTLAADYETVYQTLVDLLPNELTGPQLERIFGGNAAEFYRLR